MADPTLEAAADPFDPDADAAKTATPTKRELEAARARVLELEAKDAAEERLKETFSPAVFRAAVLLHNRACPSDHDSDAGSCGWHQEGQEPNDSTRADWTREQHVRWAQLVTVGIAILLEQGWTVTPPKG